LHQVGTSSLLIYMMHGHTYIKLNSSYWKWRSRTQNIWISNWFYDRPSYCLFRTTEL